MHVRHIVSVRLGTDRRTGGKFSESVRRSWTFAVRPLQNPAFTEEIWTSAAYLTFSHLYVVLVYGRVSLALSQVSNSDRSRHIASKNITWLLVPLVKPEVSGSLHGYYQKFLL